MAGALLLLLAGCARNGERPPRTAEEVETAEADVELRQRMETTCPMMIEGTRVELEEMDRAVALSFTTDTGEVDALRERVRALASMYAMPHAQDQVMWHQMPMDQGPMQGPEGRPQGPGDMQQRQPMDHDEPMRPEPMEPEGMERDRPMGPTEQPMGREAPMGQETRMGELPRVESAVEQIEQGARIIMAATDPQRIQDLQQHMRMHEQRFDAGQCWVVRSSQQQPQQPQQPRQEQETAPQPPTPPEGY